MWASVPRAERKHDGRRQNLSPAGGPTQFLRATGTLVCYCSSTCVLFAHALGARINFSRDCVVHLTGALFVLGFLLAVVLVLVLAPVLLLHVYVILSAWVRVRAAFGDG